MNDPHSTELSDEVNIAWRDITYDVPLRGTASDSSKKDVNNDKTKRVLHGLSGHVLAGQVVAVMGPSGSGKTSLI